MTFKGAADGAEKIKERRVRGSQEKHRDPIFLLSRCPAKSPPPGVKRTAGFHPLFNKPLRQYMSLKNQPFPIKGQEEVVGRLAVVLRASPGRRHEHAGRALG